MSEPAARRRPALAQVGLLARPRPHLQGTNCCIEQHAPGRDATLGFPWPSRRPWQPAFRARLAPLADALAEQAKAQLSSAGTSWWPAQDREGGLLSGEGGQASTAQGPNQV